MGSSSGDCDADRDAGIRCNVARQTLSETTNAFDHGKDYMKHINNAEMFSAQYKYMSCHSVPFSILESEFSESVSLRFQNIMIRSVMAAVASCLLQFLCVLRTPLKLILFSCLLPNRPAP